MREQEQAGYTVARILMSAIFLVAGARKLLSYTGTVGYFGSLGIPAPELVVGFVAVLEIMGAIALIAGWRTREVALMLAVFTLVSCLLGHRFWSADGPQFGNQLNHFLKNVAMVGGFIVIALAAPRRSAAQARA